MIDKNRKKQAVKIALDALKKERQVIAFDANMFRNGMTRGDKAEKAAKRYEQIVKAMETLNEWLNEPEQLGLPKI